MAVGVVLSGGGPLAVAWESGVASGLASRGVVLSTADRILGTSAGAIVGAQLAAGHDPQAMASAIMEEKVGSPSFGARIIHPQENLAKLPELLVKAQRGNAERVEVGAYALQVATPETEPTYVARMERYLGLIVWPARSLGIVAVDVASGEAIVFDQGMGATLGKAVAASCSLPGLSPPVCVGRRRYFDGGLRTTSNADLLLGCEKVVLFCFTLSGPAGDRILARTYAQVTLLEERGAQVKIITPDEASLTAIGPRSMDVKRRCDVAEAGTRQGNAVAPEILRFSAALAS